ncbi:MAG: DoxX family protein [Pseudomonadota bacterium]
MSLIARYDRLTAHIQDRLAPVYMPTATRLVFAGTLFVYFWNSAQTKVGEGLFVPDFGAYAQILPRVIEAVGYDPSQIGALGRAVVLFGTYTEFLLPVLIVAGLFTRFAALGMIGFILVQSYVDIVGHGVDAATIGSWFDRVSSSAILDQRAFWVLALLSLVSRGAGPLSLDALLTRWRGAPVASAAQTPT